MAITVNKADGTVEPYDPQKLMGSLRRAGADETMAQHIAEQIEMGLADGMTTQEIYRRAFRLLRSHRREHAARYSLKRAVLDFGPSGFPFEGYLAEIFRSEGYEASVDQHIKGKCVEHEVDVVLRKNGETIFVEAKFHNTPGFKTDLQVALYVEARGRDIAAANGGASKSMLVTNTKFTSFAEQFSRCAGLELLGWDYPGEGNLHSRIEHAGIYPITTLTTLSKREKIALLNEKVVLCKGLSRHEDALARAGVPTRRMQGVLAEASALCGSTAG